jgi:hypothetical protein
MTRQEANKAIIEILLKWIDKYPEMRFGQLLINLGILQQVYDVGPNSQPILGSQHIHDPWNDESRETLDNVEATVTEIEYKQNKTEYDKLELESANNGSE